MYDRCLNCNRLLDGSSEKTVGHWICEDSIQEENVALSYLLQEGIDEAYFCQSCFDELIEEPAVTRQLLRATLRASNNK